MQRHKTEGRVTIANCNFTNEDRASTKTLAEASKVLAEAILSLSRQETAPMIQIDQGPSSVKVARGK